MSITLTSPYTVSVKGVSVEDDTVGACTGMSMDYLALMMTYTFKIGTLVGSPSNLNVGPYSQNPPSQNVVVTVYMGTTNENSNGLTAGQWWLNGVLQGTTIAGATLAPIITQLLANRNTAEGFVAVSGGLLPGTTVAWTQL